MLERVLNHMQRSSLAQQFMLASFVTLVSGMLGIAWWVGQQIQDNVVQRTAATTALYVDSALAPTLGESENADVLSPQQIAHLDRLLQDTSLGQQIVALKVWSPDGRVLYSTTPETIGQTFPIKQWLALALNGTVSAKISNLDDDENVGERTQFTHLLEMYTPVRQHTSGQVIAVAEFYGRVDELEEAIVVAQRRSWLIVAVVMVVIYVLLAGFVQRASNTIDRQQTALSTSVAQLQTLLAQNQQLHARVQRAAARSTALNERMLRRISAELHDGPAQDVSLALLRIDHVVVQHADGAPTNDQHDAGTHLDIIQRSLRHALHEIRAISGGLGLPHLSQLTLTETVLRAARTHERRTGTTVAVAVDGLPDHASLPVKITLYRVVQEALTNAYRHAAGTGQNVRAWAEQTMLHVLVCDHGPGFDDQVLHNADEHLGVAGMRERVESLGGMFRIETAPNQGTRVHAVIPVDPGDHAA